MHSTGERLVLELREAGESAGLHITMVQVETTASFSLSLSHLWVEPGLAIYSAVATVICCQSLCY